MRGSAVSRGGSTRIRLASDDDVDAIAKVQVDTWRSTYRGIVPDRVLDELAYDERARSWARILSRDDGAFAFVAEDSAGVIAFASGGPNGDGYGSFAGKLHAVYVLSSYQGSGQGRALVGHVARRLMSASIQSMLVWVFTQNPACRFYERMGGKPCGEKTISLGGKDLGAVAYGWNDVRVLGCC